MIYSSHINHRFSFSQDGSTWLTQDCRTRRRCQNNKVISTPIAGCKSPEHCVLDNFEYKCKRVEPKICTGVKNTLRCLTCTGMKSMYECLIKGTMKVCSAKDVSFRIRGYEEFIFINLDNLLTIYLQ